MASETPPLSPPALLRHMADALPTHAQGDGTSDLSSSLELVALLTHACMVAYGFRLFGFVEDKKTEDEFLALAPRLPARWNAGGASSLAFVYAHDRSAMHFVVRVDRMGGRAEIRGLAMIVRPDSLDNDPPPHPQDDRIFRLEAAMRDYVVSAALPLRIPLGDDGAEAEGARSELPDKIRAAFVSEEKIAELASLIKIDIIQRMTPSLQKEGYENDSRQGEEAPDDRAAREDVEAIFRRQGRPPVGPPSRPQPLQPAEPPPSQRPFNPFQPFQPQPQGVPIPAPDPNAPPGWEDEHQVLRGPGEWPAFGGGGNLGQRDLHPPGLGPHDPLVRSFVPSYMGGSWGGIGGIGGPGGGAGMHPTPDDPLFQRPGNQGGVGGSGGVPDLQAPPGARWDPAFPGQPRPGGGRGNGRFGGPGGFGGDII